MSLTAALANTCANVPPTAAHLIAPHYVPTHPDRFVVEFGDNLSSKLVATRAYKAGEVITKVVGTTPGTKRYTTVQVSRDAHIELNSDIVYMNHACDPSCTLDTDKMEVRAVRDIPKGGEMCFFYPSSEWEMSQPFDCWCGAHNCVKAVRGAKFLTDEQVEARAVMSHIRELREEQRRANAANAANATATS